MFEWTASDKREVMLYTCTLWSSVDVTAHCVPVVEREDVEVSRAARGSGVVEMT